MKKKLLSILLILIVIIIFQGNISIANPDYPDIKPFKPEATVVEGERGKIPIWNKPEKYCANGIKLNTDVPFIGDCIHFWKTSGNQIGQLDAFPYLMGGLMKIIMTAILVISFVLIVVAGVMVSASGMDPKMYSKGMGMIKKVATGIALLGASGVILKIINPNFFV